MSKSKDSTLNSDTTKSVSKFCSVAFCAEKVKKVISVSAAVKGLDESLVISDSDEAIEVENRIPESWDPEVREKVIEVESKTEAVEVMCGCARLTKELNVVGFRAVGIDCKDNKDTPQSKCKWMDLSSSRAQNEAEAMIFSK